MTQNNLLELAKNGDAGAIAALFSRSVHSLGVTISVDWQGGQLNLRFTSSQIPDQASLSSFAAERLKAIQVEGVSTVRLFGYQQGQPVPAWNQYVDVTPEPTTSQTVPVAPVGGNTQIQFFTKDDVKEGDRTTISEATIASQTTLQVKEQPQSKSDDPAAAGDRFLVCGLGSLGQYSVLSLKRFALRESGVYVTAIDRVLPEDWEVQNLLELLAEPPILGDCRNDDVLLKAGIEHCRAILLVTSDDSVNIETAIASRRLNPKILIVARSSRQSLNELLKQQLGDFLALEPTDLPAPAFALAGLRQGIIGNFNIGNYRFQVIEQKVEPKDYRFDGFPATMLHKKTYRLLSYIPSNANTVFTQSVASPHRAFYQWHADTRIQAGDAIAYVEVLGQADTSIKTIIIPQKSKTRYRNFRLFKQNPLQPLLQKIQALSRGDFGRKVNQFWQWIQAQQTRQVIGLGLTMATFLWILGAVLLKYSVRDITWNKAISAGAILLLGGYGDVFGGLENDQVPPWVQFICFLITVISFLFVLGVFGLIADTLISSRFDFLKKRVPAPEQNHVVLVGFGRLGRRIASILQEFKQPFVAITEHPPEDDDILTQIPIVVGDLIEGLDKVNLSKAKSIIVVTDNQMLNLEVGLIAREVAARMRRDIGLVLRAYDQRFSDNLTNLLPDARALSAYALSAEAFAGAAFGENILGLFRLNRQTILVAEYRITENDTLAGKLLAQVAYGYSVIPVFHQKGTSSIYADEADLMPQDDRLLQVGDRLVVLASINGLRRIERGEMTPPRRWLLTAEKPLNAGILHYAGNDLARISGCNLEEARAFMNNLPSSMELKLYDYQAHQLSQDLSKQLPIKLTDVK